MATRDSVSGYLARTPAAQRAKLRQIRAAIIAAAPGITERISYRIPTFDLDGQYLIYMAAFKEHVSIYPVTAGMVKKYGNRIAPFRSGKGTLRFALDQPIPTDLVTKLAKVRVQERRRRGARADPRRATISSRVRRPPAGSRA